MKDTLIDIGLFLITLRSEVDAFDSTRTWHDQGRVLKAITHLERQVAELRNKVMAADLASGDDLNDEAKTRD